MKLVALLAVLLNLQICLAEEIVVNHYKSAEIDGVKSGGEWADCMKIEAAPDDTVEICMHVNNADLYFSIAGSFKSYNVRFPEILIDSDYSRDVTWQPGDLWFHISATYCHSNGEYANFDGCTSNPEPWKAYPAFQQNELSADTFEIMIPSSMTGISTSEADTIGIAFVFTNTATFWQNYPADADRMSPETWLRAVIRNDDSGIEDSGLAETNFRFRDNYLLIDDYRKYAGSTIRIMDLQGRIVHRGKIDSRKIPVNLPPGMFLVQAGNKFGRIINP
jgi:hypothetical protein